MEIRVNDTRTAPTSPPAPSAAVRPRRVLVVEDEQDIAGLIKHALERSGDGIVEIVGTGDAALRAVNEQPPDLVILDLNLPVLSGTEVCRILRGRPSTANIPIIMLSARTAETDRVSGLDLGADDYVTKPFSLRELAARVRAVLRRRQPGEAPGAATNVYRRTPRRRLRCRCHLRRRKSGPADTPRVRAAEVSRRESQSRAVARPPARARVGLRALHRNALG
jgi:DNA-binding response OmpR family regulator